MDLSLVVSVAAATISLITLMISAVLSVHQLRLTRQAAHVAPLYELMNEFRKPEFHDHYNYVVSELRASHDPAVGVYGLPDNARSAVLDIIYFFQNAMIFAGFDILDESKIVAILQKRMVSAWDALRPYIETERLNNSAVGARWLTTFERYADNVRGIPENEVMEAFVRVKKNR